MKTFRAFALASTAIVLCQPAIAAGDAVAGKTVFENQCSICHTTVAGRNGFGPSLAGVFGRHSGELPDYKYSTAMANAGLVWDAPAHDALLTSSTEKVPGTAMPVSISDLAVRANVIAYLATLGPPTAPRTSAGAMPSAAPLGEGLTGGEFRSMSARVKILTSCARSCAASGRVFSGVLVGNRYRKWQAQQRCDRSRVRGRHW